MENAVETLVYDVVPLLRSNEEFRQEFAEFRNDVEFLYGSDQLAFKLMHLSCKLYEICVSAPDSITLLAGDQPVEDKQAAASLFLMFIGWITMAEGWKSVGADILPDSFINNALIPTIQKGINEGYTSQSETEIALLTLIWNFALNEELNAKLLTFGIPSMWMKYIKEFVEQDSIDEPGDFFKAEGQTTVITVLMVMLRSPKVAKTIKENCQEEFDMIGELWNESSGADLLRLSIVGSFVLGRDESDENDENSAGLLEMRPEVLDLLIEAITYQVHGDAAPGAEQCGEFDFLVIIKALVCIAVSDSNKGKIKEKMEILRIPIFQLIHMFVKGMPEIKPNIEDEGSPGGGKDDIETFQACIELLSQLSFCYEDDNELQSVYTQEEQDQFNLRDMLKQFTYLSPEILSKVGDETQKDVGNLLKRLEDKSRVVTLPSISNPVGKIENKNKKHVMVSYCWAAKSELVAGITESLRKKGVDVWRDRDGSSIVSPMSGAADDKMAEAIEMSDTVVIFVSPEYKESANCRMEAKYANDMRKLGLLKTVFVMVDQDYTTRSKRRVNGWLGFMLGDALWYPLYDETHIESTAAKVYKLFGEDCKKWSSEVSDSVESVENTSGLEEEGQNEESTLIPTMPSIAPSQTSPSPNNRVLIEKAPEEVAWKILQNEKCAKDFSKLATWLNDQGVLSAEDLLLLREDEELMKDMCAMLKPLQSKKLMKALSKG